MRSDDDKKNYWRKYSKFGQHEQVTKNLTLNQNNQKEIITVKTSLIDQQFSRSDYKLHKTSYLSSNTKISDVTMMGKRGTGSGEREAGNGKRETGNGKRETRNRKQGASHGGRKNEKWEQKQRKEMKILIGLRFQPRSQGSLLSVPTDSRRKGERTWERGCWGSS